MKIANKGKYEDICRELGFNQEIEFVEITDDGEISFTVGKREEIMALYHAANKCGYKPSASLLAAIENR